MKPIQILTPTEQVALYLEQEIESGQLAGHLPGMKALSTNLGVNHKTVDGAVRILEGKGLVASNGTGRRRSIPAHRTSVRKALKVNILPYDPDDTKHHYMIQIRDQLLRAGHQAAFGPKSLTELRMDLSRIQNSIARNPADAWIVQSAGREVLEWFSRQDFPSFALFGRFRNVPLAAAGTGKEEAIADAVKQLHELGHRRIVMLVQEEQCLPHPASIPRQFLSALDKLGIPSGRYNLPYWQKGGESFRKCLDSLFQHTPPTALFIPEPPLFIAAQQHLARRGIVAPDQVSLICHDPSPVFHYCHPSIAHIGYDLVPCIKRVLEWTRNVASRKPDLRQVVSKSRFIPGGTIGPPPC